MGGGGGPRPPFPTYVWTTLGGWYNENPNVNWKRNTALGGLAILFAAYQVFKIGAANERRSIPARPIPSQSWAAHTLEDDPNYFQKLEHYEQNYKSIWSRISPFTD